jgi:hypothetical protein
MVSIPWFSKGVEARNPNQIQDSEYQEVQHMTSRSADVGASTRLCGLNIPVLDFEFLSDFGKDLEYWARQRIERDSE